MLHPKLQWHGCLGKKSKTNLYNMSVFSFYRPVLLMSMLTRDMMCNPYFLEERIEFFILTSPIGLYCQNILIKLPHNMSLETLECLEHI
jgi:hypothetical protein